MLVSMRTILDHAGQCAMARASYLKSARAMALGIPPLAWFYSAAWPDLSPPLTHFGCAGNGPKVPHITLADMAARYSGGSLSQRVASDPSQ